MVHVTIITPTIGGKHLAKCLSSVALQRCGPDIDISHLAVVDGPCYVSQVRAIVQNWPKTVVVTLPWNTGKGGWNGHKIYAAVPHLLDERTDYVIFLDEDNTLEPDHVASMVACIQENPGAAWAFALRRIIDKNDQFICNDVCESLGSLHHTVLGKDDFLVDVNCYMLSTRVAHETSWCWQRKARDPTGEVDRVLYKVLSNVPHATSGRFTVNYRVGDARSDSVQALFFLDGNLRLWSGDRDSAAQIRPDVIG